MNTTAPVLKEVAAILRSTILPANRVKIKPFAGRKNYRGKLQCVVGYSWCRPNSHFMTGRVNQTVLGYGKDWLAAINSMCRKVS